MRWWGTVSIFSFSSGVRGPLYCQVGTSTSGKATMGLSQWMPSALEVSMVWPGTSCSSTGLDRYSQKNLP